MFRTFAGHIIPKTQLVCERAIIILSNRIKWENTERTHRKKICSGQGNSELEHLDHVRFMRFVCKVVFMRGVCVGVGARAKQPFVVMVIECWTTHKMQLAAINMFALSSGDRT